MKNNGLISDLRLVSLPLSLSGVVCGILLAAADYHVEPLVVLLLVLAAASLHLLSASSETETCSKALKRLFLALTIVSGVAMLYFSFGTILLMEPLILLVAGYMILRAVMNTEFVSRGKGIVYTFVLFGLLAVLGSYYICSHSFASWPLLFPAASVGFLAVAAKADCTRKPFVLGFIVAGWLTMIAYSCLRMFDPWHFLFVLTLPLFVWIYAGLCRNSLQSPDRYLNIQAISVFLFASLTGIGFLVYLI